MVTRSRNRLVLPREAVLAIFAIGLLVGLLFQSSYRRHEHQYIQSLEQRIRLLEKRVYPAEHGSEARKPEMEKPRTERSRSGLDTRKEDPLLLCWAKI